MTNLSDDKKGAKYEVGLQVRIYDADEEKFIDGIVTEVGDETICVKWDDLLDDTEYEIKNIELKGDTINEIY